MNVIKFFNSKDVANYLARTGYKFTTLQTAFIVWNNKSLPLFEKRDAFKQIIVEMPDCPLPKRRGEYENQSTHVFLREYMDLLEEWSKIFRDSTDAVYMFKVSVDGVNDLDDEYVYPTLKECMTAVKDYMDESEAEYPFTICRQYIHGAAKPVTARFFADGQLADIRGHYRMSKHKEELAKAFEWMWFDIPTPFKTGDILVNNYCNVAVSPDGEPFALRSLGNWNSAQYIKNGLDRDVDLKWIDKHITEQEEYGDNTDMSVNGYFVMSDGTIYAENIYNYIDCEFYRGSLTGANRSVKAVSGYLKRQIGLDVLLNTYKIILDEEEVVSRTSALNIRAEVLPLVGLGKNS